MDHLPAWTLWIIPAAVGFSPVFAFRSPFAKATAAGPNVGSGPAWRAGTMSTDRKLSFIFLLDRAANPAPKLYWGDRSELIRILAR